MIEIIEKMNYKARTRMEPAMSVLDEIFEKEGNKDEMNIDSAAATFFTHD